ncbi:hypothetical protein BSKO_01728 [Bryopsis sp. KO-2023]|nr:hypothetical protein BSKO_01728 [Bryopsis sp. KO-2023]
MKTLSAVSGPGQLSVHRTPKNVSCRSAERCRVGCVNEFERVCRRSVLRGGVILAAGGSGYRLNSAAETSVETEALTNDEEPVVRASPPPTYVSAPGRVIAIGDLHGDLQKTLNSLRIAGVMEQDKDGAPVWCGGDTTVVQLGDVLDRGDCEIGIIMLLRDLGKQATKEGGAVYMINGNHESLNICGNFRYVTRGAFYESALAAGVDRSEAMVWESQLMSRVALFSPGGLVANELAKNPTVLVVNDTVFAHGGLLPVHVEYGLEKINAEMAAWMRGEVNDDGSKATPPYIAMGGANSILWNRTLAQEKFKSAYDKYFACSLLKTSLGKLGKKRLVVGHTPQINGCNCECGGQIWRVDVGMSQGVLNAGSQVLLIEKDGEGSTQVRPLGENVPPQRQDRRASLINGSLAKMAAGHGKVFGFEWISKRIVINRNAVDG